MTRTIVSFEAPEGPFPTDRREDDGPPGREIADLVSEALRRHGLDHRVDERQGWAWDIFASDEHASIESVVGLVDDAPIQWLIVTTTRQRRRPWKRNRNKPEIASIRDAWIQSIVDVTAGPHGMTNVRWYDQENFDRDHGATWSPTAFD